MGKVTLKVNQHWRCGKIARIVNLCYKVYATRFFFVVRVKVSSVRCSHFLESLTQLFVRLVCRELLSLYQEITLKI